MSAEQQINHPTQVHDNQQPQLPTHQLPALVEQRFAGWRRALAAFQDVQAVMRGDREPSVMSFPTSASDEQGRPITAVLDLNAIMDHQKLVDHQARVAFLQNYLKPYADYLAMECCRAVVLLNDAVNALTQHIGAREKLAAETRPVPQPPSPPQAWPPSPQQAWPPSPQQ